MTKSLTKSERENVLLKKTIEENNLKILASYDEVHFIYHLLKYLLLFYIKITKLKKAIDAVTAQKKVLEDLCRALQNELKQYRTQPKQEESNKEEIKESKENEGNKEKKENEKNQENEAK